MSLLDLIRQSMRRRRAFDESAWTTGSSPVMTGYCENVALPAKGADGPGQKRSVPVGNAFGLYSS